jgi:arsenate reductase-like glutaredoxin family protein
MSNERVMPIVTYGIKTCDTMKKAGAFLNKRIIDGVMGTIEWE